MAAEFCAHVLLPHGGKVMWPRFVAPRRQGLVTMSCCPTAANCATAESAHKLPCYHHGGEWSQVALLPPRRWVVTSGLVTATAASSHKRSPYHHGGKFAVSATFFCLRYFRIIDPLPMSKQGSLTATIYYEEQCFSHILSVGFLLLGSTPPGNTSPHLHNIT